MPRKKLPPHIEWTGFAYRATSYDVPLWVAPNRQGGRWNIAYVESTQYMCLDAEAPFAEQLRHEDLRTENEAAMFRTSIWQLQINEGYIIDYSTFDKAETAGFPPEALVDDDHERCQAEAQRLRNLGARGVLTPSAALPESINLTLFGARVQIEWGATVTIAAAIPVQKLAAAAPPPHGLVQKVRFYDDAHPLLDAYAQNRRRRR